NMGTIIRTAVAASIDGIITSQNCVDIYNSKSIRASMGTVFFAPIETHDFDWLQNQNSEIIVSSLDSDAVNYETIDKVDKSSILVIGSEAHGISEKIVKIANQKIKIPLSEKIESLNAAISTAILISKIFGFKG
ncbi:MAG: RNA methyltransferase, partial [Candidatus Cloacimonadota bacterium]|nr:RNA methyltransferase [Candidatus Cloacimonadota bacterium]